MKKNNIFGIHPILEAIEAGKTFDKLYLQKGVNTENIVKIRNLARESKIPTQYVPVEKLNKLTAKNHQGAFAVLSEIDFYAIEQILPQVFEQGKTPFLLILDQINDVRNFGAITRTAECVGVHAIIIPDKGSAAINADALKTSAGALFNIPICRESNLKTTIEFLQLSGLQVVGATEKSDNLLYANDFTLPTAIVMGNEEKGVSPEILKLCNTYAKLPMLGKTQSLNVSVACGAILYEVIRQRLN